MKKLFKHIGFYTLLLNSTLIIAQVNFEAKVSKNKLGLNERLRIDFVMNENGDNFTPPNFENFEIIGG
ncbi:MAG: BatD family protein, partial [Bacteroidota bacterium]|nr:BatD family protein [Bacteroidota bacterium]